MDYHQKQYKIHNTNIQSITAEETSRTQLSPVVHNVYNTNGYILLYIPFRDLFKLYILNTLITRILLMSRS